ncbi:MAG: transposase, partial [Hyphomicrobium sp.]|nr:transposase [Hyphomicrobium sp.]
MGYRGGHFATQAPPVSVAEKRWIVAEADQPRTNKAAVARRHGISDSQLYAWRKVLGSETHAGFLSVIT